MVLIIGVKGSFVECPPVSPSQIWPNVNRIDISVWELVAQVESDPGLALDEDLGIKRDRFDQDMCSTLTIFSMANSSLWEGLPQVPDSILDCRFKCHSLRVVVA